MYKRILVPVDGSGISDRALHEALSLAKDEQAQVRIVHAVDTMPPAAGEVYVDLEIYRQSCLDGGRDVLDRALVLARQAGVEAAPALVETQGYHPSTCIVDEAKRWPADLIVIGTHGRSGLMHLLLGSVAEGVVRHAPVPVLLVRGAQPAPEKTTS